LLGPDLPSWRHGSGHGTREHETVYVLEGDLRFKLDDELRATPSGSFVFIPRGVAHSFQNVGEEPGRMVVMFAPAGMEGFFDRLSQLTAFDPDEFRRAAAEVGRTWSVRRWPSRTRRKCEPRTAPVGIYVGR
jgi:cupin domain